MVTQVKRPAKRRKSKSIRKTARTSDRTPVEQRKASILKFIEKHGSSRCTDMAAVVPWSYQTVRSDAKILCEESRLHRTAHQLSNGGCEFIFHLGPAPTPAVAQDVARSDEDEQDVLHRPVVKSWAPCHRRDLWACAMFPVPAVLLEQHA